MLQCDDDFTSLFNAEEMSDHKFHFQSTSSSECLDSGADYAEICMQSKLTEIGLRSVNKVYKMLRDMNAKVTESRTKSRSNTVIVLPIFIGLGLQVYIGRILIGFQLLNVRKIYVLLNCK
ncbi:hypothetical protein KIN20_009970 [Parelaphostrongylus tenuis]|uniref:Uncharacterized protein n=1 Tax=Parelaphostrongylus tenuis TaxID=148309 RepID=A0AAD5MPX0_PARTN|nr:hypothetical protein KIN20_009967 [Parelaphostrongylus tenuis]KAJ1353361.1 hypothetical protein KIN20_009970 [Parelaphostrongylus tenuis]